MTQTGLPSGNTAQRESARTLRFCAWFLLVALMPGVVWWANHLLGGFELGFVLAIGIAALANFAAAFFLGLTRDRRLLFVVPLSIAGAIAASYLWVVGACAYSPCLP